MKQIILFCLILFLHTNLKAQKQTNFWYFGGGGITGFPFSPTQEYAGLDFNSGGPVIVNNGAKMQGNEGNATISDANGNLLFYTNGKLVYDNTHTQMPNGFGLAGDYSSTHASLIVPWPNSDSLYYIFTTDSKENEDSSKGLNYHIVDMSLNGGNGDVVLKNQQLLDLSTERLAGAHYIDGCGFWIVGHGRKNKNSFYAWRIDATGIVDTVISTIGPLHGNVADTNYIGQMKISPNGQLLAVARENFGGFGVNNPIDLFDFNQFTGEVTNYRALVSTLYGPFLNPYGVEFSPNSQVVYASTLSPSNIVQFDLNRGGGHPDSISRNVKEIFSFLKGPAQLQLANDGKIYTRSSNLSALLSIDNPNTIGAGLSLTNPALTFTAPNTPKLGLTNYLGTWFDTCNYKVSGPLTAEFTFDTACLGNLTSFTDQSINNTCSFHWDFGEPISGANNVSNNQNPSHVYLSSGNYTVTLVVGGSCGIDSIKHVVFVAPPFSLNLKDTLVCGTLQSVTLDAGPGVSYLWDTGEMTQTINTSTEGYHTVNVFNGICTQTGKIGVTFYPEPEKTNDTIFCLADTFLFSPNCAPTTPCAVSGTGNSFYRFDSIYIGAFGFKSSDITYSYNLKPTLNLVAGQSYPIKVITNGSAFTPGLFALVIFLDINGDGDFNDIGEESVLAFMDRNGDTYEGVLNLPINMSCASILRIKVAQKSILDPCKSLGGYLDRGDYDDFLIQTGTTNYIWSVNGTPTGNDTILYATTDGTYTVQVNPRNGCMYNDTFDLTLADIKLDLGNDTIICNGTSINLLLDAGNLATNFLWNTTEITQTITADSGGMYIVNADNGLCFDADTINVFEGNSPGVISGNDTSVCVNAPVLLFADDTIFCDTVRPTCIKTFSSSCTQYIDSVSFAGMTNGPTGCTSLNGAGYNDYIDNFTITVVPGQKYPITIKRALASVNFFDKVQVWIDFNRNGLFTDVGEQVIDISAPPTIVNDSIFIPDWAQCNAVMRITRQVGLFGVCATAALQETEDYLLTFTSGGNGSNFTWTLNGNFIDTGNNITVFPQDTSSYAVAVDNGTGCIGYDTVDISTIGNALYIGNDTVICNGDSLQINAPNMDALNYLWSTGDTTNSIKVFTQGNYSLTITDSFGCVNTDTIFVQDSCGIPLEVYANASLDTICPGCFLLSADAFGGMNSNYVFEWMAIPAGFVNNNEDPGTVCLQKTTQYIVVLSDGVDTVRDTASVYVYPKSNINLSSDTTIVAGNSLDLFVSGGEIYTWSPIEAISCNICASPTVSPFVNTTYYVDIIDSNGCSYKDSVVVTVEYKDVYLPNAFSPNRDGPNDLFKVRGLFGEKRYLLKVYDRWGNKVFETEDKDIAWDGTKLNTGNILNKAVFAWYMEIEWLNGKEVLQRGNVTLVR